MTIKSNINSLILNFLTLIISITSLNLISCRKKEKADPLTSLSMIGKDTIFIRKGQTKKLDYYYNPMSGVSPDFSWDTSNKNVATIAGDGTVNALNIGTTTITLRVNDDTGLSCNKTIYVLEKPTIAIPVVSDITYCSANFSTQYTLGGGNNKNTVFGFVWDTISRLDPAKFIGKSIFTNPQNQYSIDLFDAGVKYYVRAFVRTPIDTVYGESVIFESLPLPADILGNYMLNIPLAFGFIAKSKDWIYYVNKNDNYRLYRIRNDLSNKEKLSDKNKIFSINVIGSNLYFAPERASHVSYINTSKIDGTGDQNILAPDNVLSYEPFQVQGSTIYYSDNFNFRINLNGTYKLQLDAPNPLYLNIYENKLYFILPAVDNVDSVHSINECSLDGKNRKEIYRGYYLSKLGIYENAAYFIEKGVLKKIDLLGQSPMQVLPINTSFYNIINYTIYFSNISDSYKLYKSDLGGLVINKVNDDKPGIISIIDDWLYYYNPDEHLYRLKQDGSVRQLVD